MVAVVHRQPYLQHLACCSVNSRHIGSESRFLPTPPAFDAPLGRFPSEYRHPVWYTKTRMVWLPDGEKISKISLFVLTQLTNMTDTHREIPHDGIGRAYASHRTAKIAFPVTEHCICTSSSAVADRPCDALCLSVVSLNKIITCADYFIIVT